MIVERLWQMIGVPLMGSALVVFASLLGCAPDVDRSTHGASSPPPVAVVWSHQFGTSDYDAAVAVEVDGCGGVYISGHSKGDLGGPSSGGNDAFLAKYDVKGDRLWVRQFGTPLCDRAITLAVDAGGGWVAGMTYDVTSFKDRFEGRGAFIGKYDASGTLEWELAHGTDILVHQAAIIMGASRDYYVVGGTVGKLGAEDHGGLDGFLARGAATDVWQWVQQFGTAGFDRASDIIASSDGGYIVAGETEGDLAGPNQGDLDAFLLKYTGDGVLVSDEQFGTDGEERYCKLATGPEGSYYLVGQTTGSLGGRSLGYRDTFVIKFNSDDTIAWQRQFGTDWHDWSQGASSDAEGNLYIVGCSTVEESESKEMGKTKGFLAKYDPHGELKWVWSFGPDELVGQTVALGVAIDKQGDIYIVGHVEGDLFGSNLGDADAFIMKLREAPHDAGKGSKRADE
jgi:hypothetical protein